MAMAEPDGLRRFAEFVQGMYDDMNQRFKDLKDGQDRVDAQQLAHASSLQRLQGDVLSRASTERVDALQRKVAELEATIRGMQAKLGEMDDFEDTKEDVSDLKDLLRNTKNETNDRFEALDKKVGEVADKHTEHLQDVRSELKLLDSAARMQKKQCDDAIEALGSKSLKMNQTMREVHSGLDKAWTDLRTRMEDVEPRVSRVEARIGSFEGESTKLKQQLDAAGDEQVNRVRYDIRDLVARVTQLERDQEPARSAAAPATLVAEPLEEPSSSSGPEREVTTHDPHLDDAGRLDSVRTQPEGGLEPPDEPKHALADESQAQELRDEPSGTPRVVKPDDTDGVASFFSPNSRQQERPRASTSPQDEDDPRPKDRAQSEQAHEPAPHAEPAAVPAQSLRVEPAQAAPAARGANLPQAQPVNLPAQILHTAQPHQPPVGARPTRGVQHNVVYAQHGRVQPAHGVTMPRQQQSRGNRGANAAASQHSWGGRPQR